MMGWNWKNLRRCRQERTLHGCSYIQFLGALILSTYNILASTMNSKGEKHVRQADIGDYQRKLR